MISNATKQQIISHLQQVPTNTIWGVGINLFVQNVHLKNDEDYVRVVKDLQSQMNDGADNMKVVLGNTFDFFKNFPAAELSL